ncbi:hypothetical protein BOX15_Mlig025435g1 [Macrostomum lignano]|uniref:Pseudouridylate synthase 1 homolog n=1 Tax=Macrostomum lignano TaxID=282301 RepID=A0A267DK28_9PLAT|nr:hypothetical protein BOX15_Mlig025435g1 [Macrostomum lignano]
MKRPIEDEESSCASAEPTESKQAKLASDSNNDAAVAATGNTRNCTINRRRGDVKKAILMLMYSGSGYYGMQRNTGFDTIEGALFDSLLAGGHITEEEYLSPGKLQFQRASKTDKGVSALAQVVSMKLNLSDADSLKADVNSRLPTQIRLLDVFRTTKNFNCKARVNHREYAYICPSYAFASKSRPIDITYRIDSTQLELLRSCLSRYKGTKNYYNFTSGRPPGDASCNRYIIDFTVGEPFEYRDAEFVELRVRGQSFMLHQIRKMVGLAIAIVKGYCRLEAMDAVFTYKRMDVPKAPGLGLLLNKIHYGAYNEKYAAELGYSTVDWDRFEAERSEFKSSHILPEIYRGETDNRSMLEWLRTLTMHSYDFDRQDGPPTVFKQQQQQQSEQPKQSEQDSQSEAASSEPNSAGALNTGS